MNFIMFDTNETTQRSRGRAEVRSGVVRRRRWRAEEKGRIVAQAVAPGAVVAKVGVATIRRAELREGETSLTAPNNLAIRAALESAAIEFIEANGGGPGVRLRDGR